MESLGELDGSLVAVDTAPVIYFIEKYQPWVRSVKPFFQALDDGRFRAVTSSLTLAEVLVHPFRNQRPDLAAEYRQLLLGARNLRTIPVSPAIAEHAAELRSRFSFRTPDAIQVATAIQYRENRARAPAQRPEHSETQPNGDRGQQLMDSPSTRISKCPAESKRFADSFDRQHHPNPGSRNLRIPDTLLVYPVIRNEIVRRDGPKFRCNLDPKPAQNLGKVAVVRDTDGMRTENERQSSERTQG